MLIRRKSASDVSRWNSASELLLTLSALGEQPWEVVKRAAGALGPICAKFPPLHLRLEGIQGLPNNNQPRYVVASVAGDVTALTQLQAEVCRSLAPILPASEKAYVPHIVLGRLKIESEQARTALGRAVRMTPPEVLADWTADCVELLRSDAGAAGVQYQVIEKFGLGSEASASTPL